MRCYKLHVWDASMKTEVEMRYIHTHKNSINSLNQPNNILKSAFVTRKLLFWSNFVLQASLKLPSFLGVFACVKCVCYTILVISFPEYDPFSGFTSRIKSQIYSPLPDSLPVLQLRFVIIVFLSILFNYIKPKAYSIGRGTLKD